MSAVEPMVYTRVALADDIRQAGICSGDNLILHSSLRRIGPTENGPQTVVDAILDVIGPKANLMVPTFTYNLPVWNSEPFHPEKSASRVGAITEYIRNRPDVRRSFHPTHSVAVVGPDAASITRHHIDATPIGRNSPFDRMLQRNAKILMLGTFQDTNSSLHLCEVLCELPYTNVPFSPSQTFEVAWFINVREQVEYTQINEVPGCSRGFRVIEPYFIRAGVLQEVKIGNASCQLLSMTKMLDAAREILRTDPMLLLCTIEGCAICPKRRQYMSQLER